MKFSNTVFTIFFFLFFSNVVFSQSKSAETLANERIEKFNEFITTANSDLSLTTEQKIKIKEKHIKRTEKIRAISKDETLSEEEKDTQKKAVYRAFNRDVNKNILTPEQRRAQTKGKELTAKGSN